MKGHGGTAWTFSCWRRTITCEILKHKWHIFSYFNADLCEKKTPLRRKWCGFCPDTFSILSTSSMSILLLPNLTKERHDTMGIVLLSYSTNHMLILWLKIYRKRSNRNPSLCGKATLAATFNRTDEFVVIHSLGAVGGNVPWVNSVFVVRPICCWPVVRGNRVVWGRTACFVILTRQLFVFYFHLLQHLDSSSNFSLRNPTT